MRTLLRILGPPVSIGAATAAFYGTLALQLPGRRGWVLTLFVAGMLISGAGGWLVGRLLQISVLRGRNTLSVLVSDALATGAVVYVFLACFDGHPPRHSALAEAVTTSLAVILVTANSCAVGRLLFARRTGISGFRPWTAAAVLYGSIFAGVVLYRLVLPPWVALPPYPLKPWERRAVADVLAEVRTEFPPPGLPDAVRSGASLPASLVKGASLEEGETAIPLHRSKASLLDLALAEDVIIADGSRAVLGGGTVEVVAMGFYSRKPCLVPGKAADSSDRGAAAGGRLSSPHPIGWWRLDGTPLPDAQRPRLELGNTDGPIDAVFLVRPEGGLELERYRYHSLVFVPWVKSVGYELEVDERKFLPEGERNLVPVRFVHYLPVPGPLELRLIVVRPDEVVHTIPNRAGECARLERNSLLLMRVFEGAGSVTSPHELRDGRDPTDAEPGYLVFREEPGRSPGRKTTALFAEALQTTGRASFFCYPWNTSMTSYTALVNDPLDSVSSPRFQAVLNDGTVLESKEVSEGWSYLSVVFDCLPGDIVSFRFVEKPRRTEVRFPIDEIPFLPRRNYGLKDLLRMRVPYPFQSRHEFEEMLTGHRFIDSQFKYPSFRDRTGQPTKAGAAVWEILDHYYPGYWRVRHGQLQFTDTRSLRTQVRAALFGIQWESLPVAPLAPGPGRYSVE